MKIIDEILEHHGIKGQRWGVRRKRGSDGLVKTGSPKPRAKDLSDDDLRKAVKRMQMERQYRELTGEKNRKNSGANFVKKVANATLTGISTSVATYQVSKVLKKTKLLPN